MLRSKIQKLNFRIEKRDWFFLITIIFLAIIFRLFLMQYRFAIRFDEVNYLKLGVSGAIKGFAEVLHPYWSPLYPLIIALFSRIITNFELAGRLVSILCGSFILIPVFFFTKYHFKGKIAYYVVTLLAFYPPLAFFSTRAQTEPLYTLLVITGVFLGWFALNKCSSFLGFVVGLLFGLAYLTRPEGVGCLITFIAVTSVVVIFSYFQKKEVRLALIILAGTIGFGLISAPYLVYLHNITGQWTLSTKGAANQQGEAFDMAQKGDINPFHQLSDDNTQVPEDQIYHIGNFLEAQRQKGQPVFKVTPAILLEKYIRNFYRVLKYGIPQVLTTVIFILMTLGLLGEAWSKERTLRELYLLSYISFFWFLVIPLFHINERYFLPFLPICFIWVGKGIDKLIFWFKRTLKQSVSSSIKIIPHEKLANWMVLLIILGGMLLPELGKVIVRNRWSTEYWADPVEQKKAGLWLKKHTSKTPIIMSKNHAVDFYAGNYNIAESVTIPENDLERVLEYAKHRGVDYIVLNERYKDDYPQIAHLLKETDIPANLRLIYKNKDKSGLKTVIYQLIRD